MLPTWNDPGEAMQGHYALCKKWQTLQTLARSLKD